MPELTGTAGSLAGDASATPQRTVVGFRAYLSTWGVAQGLLGPLVVLAADALLFRMVVPSGVNQQFLNSLLGVTTALGLCVVLLARLRRQKLEVRRRGESYRSIGGGEATLLLFPMTPVVSYLIINRETLSLAASAIVLVAVTALTGLVVLVVPFLLRRLVPTAVTVMMGLGLSWVLYDMASLNRDFRWADAGDVAIQLILAAVVSVVGLAIYLRSRRAAYAISAVYFAVSGVAMPLAGVGRTELSADDSLTTANAARLSLVEQTDGSRLRQTPDIIVLTYDAYVGQETMLQYGIDNSAQESFLESMGFRIYPDAYSIAGMSVASMGPFLGGTTPEEGVAGDSPFLGLLREAGYQTYGLFVHDLFFREHSPAYDYYWPEPLPGEQWMLRAILEGQFAPIQVSPEHAEFLSAKRSVLSDGSSSPIFVYTHTLPSHSQNSGRCLDDETARYQARLVDANTEMRNDIEAVSVARPDAIIVVNGDHGPYLTKNCTWLWTRDYAPEDVTRLDIQDRVGAFLAIRWPEGMAAADEPIETIQDVLPAILGDLHPDLDYEDLRLPSETNSNGSLAIGGLDVKDGVIVGGPDDGERLFLGSKSSSGR